ncbi:uncharacterized protein FFNC_15720 [Fusarium fujikuroi]|nr:uncharacterized protein FFNC_15720 [Fusarium fujikuroi]
MVEAQLMVLASLREGQPGN